MSLVAQKGLYIYVLCDIPNEMIHEIDDGGMIGLRH